MDDDDIPADADQWLFAEDLTNFVFRRHAGFPRDPIGEECRELVREGFSEVVRTAAEILEEELKLEIDSVFSSMSSKVDVVEEYKTYASAFRRFCEHGGFDSFKFLLYSVHISCLGERFYGTGLEDFHYLAFTAVREALERYDMSGGGWDRLNIEADTIVEEHCQKFPSLDYEPPNYEQGKVQYVVALDDFLDSGGLVQNFGSEGHPEILQESYTAF